jgi:hypothetical protein
MRLFNQVCVVVLSLFFTSAALGPLWAMDRWKATAYGENWVEAEKQFKQAVPELASGAGVPFKDEDRTFWTNLPEERKKKVEEAVSAFYQALDTVTPGAYATRQFKITAAREVNGYILLWIDEPEIMDGGRSAVLSLETGTIVGEFWDGGIRG